MITQEQADSADIFHSELNAKCGEKSQPERWRRNGKTQRWKRNPLRFRIPVKHGLSDYDQLESEFISEWGSWVHTGADCPVAPEGHN